MEQEIVRIVDLHAAYGRGARRVQALLGVDLQVRAGEIFGLLGPNGAGKTTLLAVLEGLHRPERGSVHVAGIDVVRQPQAVKKLIGIQLQRTSLMDDLTAGELMQVYAAMYEVFPRRRRSSGGWRRMALGAWPRATRGGCRADSSSGWRWPWRRSTTLPSSCWTSRRARSTHTPAAPCGS
jgi:ABC-type branched-subunit amino acid transport system ATPase component